MNPIARSSATLLCALLAAAALPAQAHQAQVQSPQQAQQAQQARQQAESFLRKEEAAETGRRNRSTDRANQDAAVADEAAGHSDAARPARSTDPNAHNGGSTTRPAGSAPPPSYGPVLDPRRPQGTDPARKDPAEVHDETDSLTRPAAPQQSRQKQAKQAPRRREAWQPAGPLAPRPLTGNEAAAIGYGAVPVPPPAGAPQPVVPTNTQLNSCVGGACRDANGGTYNLGPNGVGVSSSGRVCSKAGTSVQCN